MFESHNSCNGICLCDPQQPRARHQLDRRKAHSPRRPTRTGDPPFKQQPLHSVDQLNAHDQHLLDVTKIRNVTRDATMDERRILAVGLTSTDALQWCLEPRACCCSYCLEPRSLSCSTCFYDDERDCVGCTICLFSICGSPCQRPDRLSGIVEEKSSSMYWPATANNNQANSSPSTVVEETKESNQSLNAEPVGNTTSVTVERGGEKEEETLTAALDIPAREKGWEMVESDNWELVDSSGVTNGRDVVELVLTTADERNLPSASQTPVPVYLSHELRDSKGPLSSSLSSSYPLYFSHGSDSRDALKDSLMTTSRRRVQRLH